MHPDTLTIPNTFPTIFLNSNQIIENVKGQEISLIKILPDIIPNCEIEIVTNPSNKFELYFKELFSQPVLQKTFLR